MASGREQPSQKLVYLRDRTPRPKTRPKQTGQVIPLDTNSRPNNEAVWLARSCFGVAGILVLYWLGVLGLGGGPESAPTWNWTLSEGLPHLVVAVAAGFIAQALLRSDARVRQWTGLLAGALLILSVQGIIRAMVGSDLDQLPLNVRVEVLVRTATFAVGIWAASYTLRPPLGDQPRK